MMYVIASQAASTVDRLWLGLAWATSPAAGGFHAARRDTPGY
jgi:hypothetical protein